MGEPGGLPSMGSHSVGHDLSDLAVAVASINQSLKSDFEAMFFFFFPLVGLFFNNRNS